MHVTRKLLRTAAAWLASAVVAVSILAPIGQFFISLADERGLYQHPSARVAAMINALAIVVGSPWFHWIGGGIVGFAIGVWVDGTLKRRDETVSASGKGAAPFPRPIPGDLAMTAPQSEYVHLNDVCGMIYGKLGSCFLRTLIDGRSAANDSILDSMGGIISNYTDVYGVRPPAQTIEKIAISCSSRHHGRVRGGGSAVYHPDLRCFGREPAWPSCM
jgi:hypothetical protein